MSERSLWYDGTQHLWLIWNFQIGTSLSNSNRKFRFESESNLEASQVPTNYCPCGAVAQWLSCWTFAQQSSVQVPLAPVRVIVASGQESDCFCSHSAKKVPLHTWTCPSICNDGVHDAKRPQCFCFIFGDLYESRRCTGNWKFLFLINDRVDFLFLSVNLFYFLHACKFFRTSVELNECIMMVVFILYI